MGDPRERESEHVDEHEHESHAERGVGLVGTLRVDLVLVLVLVLVLALPSPTVAHGTAPGVRQILTRAQDTVLVTSRGLVFGDPASRRWSLLCGAAFGTPDETPYSVAVQRSGGLLAASLEGLVHSADDGCTWQRHPALGDADVTDLEQATGTGRMWLSVFGGAHAGIHASRDDGATFVRLYAAASDEYIGSLATGAGGALYATIATTEERPRFFVLRSRDGGATWSRTALALGDDVIDVGLLVARGSEVLVRVFRFDQRRGDDLLRSTDGGASFRELEPYLGIEAAAFSPDGASVFLATAAGLLRASTSDYAFTRVGDASSASGLAVQGDRVLAGGAFLESSLIMPGVEQLATDASTLPTRFMTFDQVTAPRACAAPSTVACACELAWLDWAREFPMGAAVDAPVCAAPVQRDEPASTAAPRPAR